MSVAIDKLRRLAVAYGCEYTEDFFVAMTAILELDDRLRAVEHPAVEPVSEPLPEGWEIDEDGDARYRGERCAFVNNRGDLVLRDVGIGASRPRIPGAVARALLAGAQ